MPAKSTAKITIDIPLNLHDELTIQAVAQGKTLQDFVYDTLADRIRNDPLDEDKVWGEMSETAKKEGSISTDASERLLTRMKNA